MHKNRKKVSKKKASKLTLKHHQKYREQMEKSRALPELDQFIEK